MIPYYKNVYLRKETGETEMGLYKFDTREEANDEGRLCETIGRSKYVYCIKVTPK